MYGSVHVNLKHKYNVGPHRDIWNVQHVVPCDIFGGIFALVVIDLLGGKCSQR